MPTAERTAHKMHLFDKISSILRCEAQKPVILHEYCPIVSKKYITIYNENSEHGFYPLFQDVINDIKPALSESSIQIVQVLNSETDARLAGCEHLLKITYTQLNYILKNSLLHISADSLTPELASIVGTKSLTLSSFKPRNLSKPWFANQGNVSVESPSLRMRDLPTEIISNKILELLVTNYSVSYSTKYVGAKYPNQSIEYVPNFPFNTDRTTNVRLDLLYNLETALPFCSKTKHFIFTRQELPEPFLLAIKGTNQGIKYLVNSKTPESLGEKACEMGFKVSYIVEDDSSEAKLNFLGQVEESVTPKLMPKTIIGNENFVSSKIYLSDGKRYSSKCHLKLGQPSSIMNKVIDVPEFWDDLDYFKILEIKNERSPSKSSRSPQSNPSRP